MYYVDANIFILAVTDSGEGGATVRYFLRTLSAERKAFTSVLTLDEVIWGIQGEKDRATALEAARGMLDNPYLKLLDANAEVAEEALRLMKETKLDPRDAFHAATMRIHGLTRIVSLDGHFDSVPGIKRIDLRQLVKK